MGPHRHIRFLASVRSEGEARMVAAEGADIIDCKEPAAGALGALGFETVEAIRRAIPAHLPVSATIGDLPCDPVQVAEAAVAMSKTGVDYVKVGIFPGGPARDVVTALKTAELGGSRLVAVLLADLNPDLSLLPDMASAGFAGVMLDTFGKAGGSLPNVLPLARIAEFVATARDLQMFTGLAGSLTVEDVAILRPLGPDVLGFRGALCSASQRTAEADVTAVRKVRRALRAPLKAGGVPEALAS